jgi:pyruvate/2-oxoglutarate dehydrogenase complex dihydrolipoamide acyltransferase (E2) component
MTATPVYQEAPWPPLRNAVISVLRQHRPDTAYGLAEVDITRALAAIGRHQRELGIAVSLHAFVLYCLARAAAEHPAVLTYRLGRRLISFADADVGTAIEKRLPDRRRLPVGYIFRGAQARSLAEINWELRQACRSDLTDDPEVRLRRRVARMPEIVRRLVSRGIVRNPFRLRRFHGTIGLTNLQSPGFHRPFFALPPNIFTLTVAIGNVTERLAPEADGSWVRRQMLCLSAGADHAVIDGADLARFARRFTQLLESADGLDDTFVAESRRLMTEAAG